MEKIVMKTLTKYEKIAVTLGILVAALLFSGLFALFVNWVISLIVVSWPVTVKNWLITWAVMFIVNVLIKVPTIKN